jgi:hypothetical protein
VFTIPAAALMLAVHETLLGTRWPSRSAPLDLRPRLEYLLVDGEPRLLIGAEFTKDPRKLSKTGHRYVPQLPIRLPELPLA